MTDPELLTVVGVGNWRKDLPTSNFCQNTLFLRHFGTVTMRPPHDLSSLSVITQFYVLYLFCTLDMSAISMYAPGVSAIIIFILHSYICKCLYPRNPSGIYSDHEITELRI